MDKDFMILFFCYSAIILMNLVPIAEDYKLLHLSARVNSDAMRSVLDEHKVLQAQFEKKLIASYEKSMNDCVVKLSVNQKSCDMEKETFIQRLNELEKTYDQSSAWRSIRKDVRSSTGTWRSTNTLYFFFALQVLIVFMFLWHEWRKNKKTGTA